MERWPNVSSWSSRQRDANKHVSRDSLTTNHCQPATGRKTTCRNRRRRPKTTLSSAANIDGAKCRRKLFVGQLANHVSEYQLRLLFAKFGRVVQLKIRRDYETGASYGLVTYATTSSAQKARTSLHNVVQLPGTRRPLQVNFVDHLANYRQRKLFVGRISRDLTETDVISMFASFGDIEDCAIIRQPHTGLSAGCAFVTFADRESASAAICRLHQSQVMVGWTSSMIVKLADSRQTKLLKRLDEFVRHSSASVDRVHSMRAY